MSGLCNLIWRYFSGWEELQEVAGLCGPYCTVPFRSCSPLSFRVHKGLCLMAFNNYLSLWASSLLSKYKMIGLNILITSVGCKPQSSGGQRVTSKALAGSALSGALERIWPSVSSSHTHLLAWSFPYFFFFIFKFLFYIVCMGAGTFPVNQTGLVLCSQTACNPPASTSPALGF